MLIRVVKITSNFWTCTLFALCCGLSRVLYPLPCQQEGVQVLERLSKNCHLPRQWDRAVNPEESVFSFPLSKASLHSEDYPDRGKGQNERNQQTEKRGVNLEMTSKHSLVMIEKPERKKQSAFENSLLHTKIALESLLA